jgi:hypothetical protein
MMALTTGCPSAQKSLETVDTSKSVSPENNVTNPSVKPATVDTKTSENQTPIDPNSKDKKDGIDPKIAGGIILGATALGAFLLHKMKAKPTEVTDLPKKPIRLLPPGAESETIPKNKQSFKNNSEIIDLIQGLSPNPTISEVNKIVHTIRKQGPIVFTSTFTEFKTVESKRQFINLLFPGDAAVQYYRENLNIDNKVTKGEFIEFFQETCILMTKYYHGAIHSPQVKDSTELVAILKHDYRSNLQRFIQEIKDKADPNYNSDWLLKSKTGLLDQLGLL